MYPSRAPRLAADFDRRGCDRDDPLALLRSVGGAVARLSDSRAALPPRSSPSSTDARDHSRGKSRTGPRTPRTRPRGQQFDPSPLPKLVRDRPEARRCQHVGCSEVFGLRNDSEGSERLTPGLRSISQRESFPRSQPVAQSLVPGPRCFRWNWGPSSPVVTLQSPQVGLRI